MSGKMKLPATQKKQDEHAGFTNAIDEFKALLKDKTHPDNQTNLYHSNTKKVIERMLQEADNLPEGQGVYGLFAFLLRTNLLQRDKMIDMELEISKLKNEIYKLKK